MKLKRLMHALAITAALIAFGTAGLMAQEFECEWVDETAWAAGERYLQRGNWATYTEFIENETIELYAGRYLEAGTVHFSEAEVGYVTITITLNEDWLFEDVEENVKIQDYEDTPVSINPSPGQFAHKGYATESTFSIVVPKNTFYGVHVNVEWLYCVEADPETEPEDEELPY